MAHTLRTLLTGDIGGTNARLRLVEVTREGHSTVAENVLKSSEFHDLPALLATFLAACPSTARQTLAAASLGLAAPVLNGVAKTTNLPWPVVAEPDLAAALGVPVKLLNDLEATAWGLLATPKSALLTVQAGTVRPGPCAVIAPGTGLGQAIVWFADERAHVQATEGGHTDFAPSTDEDVALWRLARAQLATVNDPEPHVSWERVVSGPGLTLIWDCLTTQLGRAGCEVVTAGRLAGGDPGALIGRHAQTGQCAPCGESVRWLVRLLGAQAGNLALTSWSLGGVYFAGGLTDKLWPEIAAGTLARSFVAKGRYAGVLAEVPLWASRDAGVALTGAVAAGLPLLG